MKSEEKRKEIMRKAPELNKGISMNETRIYVNADYTQKQRERNKELRTEKQRRTNEGEENLAIRNGIIVVMKPRAGDRGNHQTGGASVQMTGARARDA